MPKVLKFGGTSVGSVDAIRRCIAILGSAPRGSIAVFSAFSGVTDLLSEAVDCAISDYPRAITKIETIKINALNFIKELTIEASYLEQVINEVGLIISELGELIESINFLRECYPTARDSVLAKGELISSKIIHYALLSSGINSFFADARDFIATDTNYGSAKPNFDTIDVKITGHICDKLSRGKYAIAVTQGFIGRSSDQKTSTLGRGGSDFSASIIGASLKRAGYHIESIEIFTDVNGVMTADPKLVPDAKSLNRVSASEMLEMSYYGAKVLHPSTVVPALEANIPVKILNTFNHNFPGTLITDASESTIMRFRTVVELSNIYYFKIEMDSNPNIIEKVHEFTGRILASGSVLLHSSVNLYSGAIIAKVSDETLLIVLSSNGNKPKKVNAVAVTGENIRLSRKLFAKLDVIIDNSNSKELLFSFLTPGGNSILLVSEDELNIQLIHDVFITCQFA